MNEVNMVKTEINLENGHSTDHIQLELKPLIKNDKDPLKHQSSLELLVLSQNQEDIVVKYAKLETKTTSVFVF